MGRGLAPVTTVDSPVTVTSDVIKALAAAAAIDDPTLDKRAFNEFNKLVTSLLVTEHINAFLVYAHIHPIPKFFSALCLESLAVAFS